MLAVERADALGIHQRNSQVAVLDPCRGERGERRGTQLLRGVDEVELNQPCWRRDERRAGACCSANSL